MILTSYGRDSGYCLAPRKKNSTAFRTRSGELVTAGKIDSPLPNDGVEKSFHEFGQVHDWKVARDLAIFLAFRDDFRRRLTVVASAPRNSGESHRVHRARDNHRLPKRSPHFSHISQCFVKPAQALFGRRLSGQFGFQAFGLASERTASHFAQYRFFAGEITKKRGLADFQSLHDVVDACVS